MMAMVEIVAERTAGEVMGEGGAAVSRYAVTAIAVSN
jgi:hypothetical protein